MRNLYFLSVGVTYRLMTGRVSLTNNNSQTNNVDKFSLSIIVVLRLLLLSCKQPTTLTSPYKQLLDNNQLDQLEIRASY